MSELIILGVPPTIFTLWPFWISGPWFCFLHSFPTGLCEVEASGYGAWCWGFDSPPALLDRSWTQWDLQGPFLCWWFITVWTTQNKDKGFMQTLVSKLLSGLAICVWPLSSQPTRGLPKYPTLIILRHAVLLIKHYCVKNNLGWCTSISWQKEKKLQLVSRGRIMYRNNVLKELQWLLASFQALFKVSLCLSWKP